MNQLLKDYSIEELILIISTIALSIKGFVTFYDWGYDRLKQFFDSRDHHNYQLEALKEQVEGQSEQIKQINTTLSELTKQIKMLVDSDKNDIKSYITDRHHFFCYTQGWIDDYSLDCLEKRYNDYQKEKGNSFVEGLMNELRALPKQPIN